MKIVLALVACIVLLTLWLERQRPYGSAGRVKNDVVQVRSIDKSLDYYHAYTVQSQSNYQRLHLRCFGWCPPLQVGQLWALDYKLSAAVSKRCLHFLCRHPFWFMSRATLVSGKQARLVGREPLSMWQRQHERYLELLSTWFEQRPVVAALYLP